jgi:hypothetical protein
MKALAFCMALFVAAFGAVGIFVPSIPAWVAQHAASSGVFYAVATIRIAFGLILISVAPVSRSPKILRVLGYLILITGITTALTGLIAIDRARAMIEWWLQQGSGITRLTSFLLLALGGFIAYACSAARRDA